MTYTEGNVLIIEYMGGTREVWRTTSKVTGKSEELLWQNCELEQVNGCMVGFPNNSSPDGFYVCEQYIHKDWNQIMPVVKKLMGELTEYTGDPISDKMNIVAARMRGWLELVEIGGLWTTVVQAIKLINKTKADDRTKSDTNK